MNTRSLLTPASPSIFAPLTPRPITPRLKKKRLENLTHCLVSSVPAEIVYPYPSFEQVYAEAQGISSFLDLYQKDTEDDARLRTVKSPTSPEADHDIWAQPLESVMAPVSDLRRRRALRRSRSLSDIGELHMHATQPTAGRTSETEAVSTLTGAERVSPRSAQFSPDIPVVRLNGEEPPTTPLRAGAASDQRSAPPRHRRGRSLEEQGALSSSRPHRNALGVRLRALMLSPLPPPSAPLPSPPSALLTIKSPKPTVHALSSRRLLHPYMYAPLKSPSSSKTPLKSPQAPYWVGAKAQPKTPRTVRNERRQGWGGQWNMGNVGRVVDQLKEM